MTARPSSDPSSKEARDADAASRKAADGAGGDPNDRLEQWEDRIYDADHGRSDRGDDRPNP